MMILDQLSKACFKQVHARHLIYNQCWEDPRLDHVALELGPEDSVVVITSAGCNALDYALAAPHHVYAVDVNPRQNALLELKLAGIRRLDYESFFRLFGYGRLHDWFQVYGDLLRPELSPSARDFWDRRGWYFSNSDRRGSFYFHGTAGTFAWLVNHYIDKVIHLRDAINSLLNATDVQEQQRIFYEEQLDAAMFKPLMKWFLRRDAILSLLGVPGPQRRQLEKHYPGGVARFIQDRVETVFSQISLSDNYFWRVYLTGQYTPDCCPNYLKREHFSRLKNGLVDRISVRTDSLLGFLRTHPQQISRFVLLDHMDWLCQNMHDLLADEWQAICDRAAPQARVLFRSAGLMVDYVDPLEVRVRGRTRRVGDLLTYQHDLARDLHTVDRVNTYGSFYIADLQAV
jgi:S-adenosylmethionine-diacylglycerol 3-amino-3-carboxypropyl transferase